MIQRDSGLRWPLLPSSAGRSTNRPSCSSFGWLPDRAGLRPIHLCGALLLGIVTPPGSRPEPGNSRPESLSVSVGNIIFGTAMHTTTLNKFGDLAEGDTFTTPGITVSEAHILAFAGLTGDFMPHHTDEQFARDLGFRGRLAHGLLVLGLIDGLKNRSMIQFDVVAALNWESWRFVGPVYAGDRIDAEIKIAAKRLTKSGTRGIVTLDIKVRNQHGEVVQEGSNQLMLAA